MCSLDHIDWYSTLIRDTQTATALGKLGHPDGELNLTKAAAKHGVIQMVDQFQEKSTLTDFTRMVRFQHSLHALLTKLWTHRILVKCNSTNCGSQACFFLQRMNTMLQVREQRQEYHQETRAACRSAWDQGFIYHR